MAVEFDTHGPWDGVPFNEAEWRRFARYFGKTSGVAHGAGDAADVSVVGGDLHVGTMIAVVEGHVGELESEGILTPGAPHASLDRIDRVVVRGDFTNNRIELDLLEGTPGSSPSVPGLTQTSSIHEFPICQARVAGGSGTITLTHERQWTAPGWQLLDQIIADRNFTSGDETLFEATAHFPADRFVVISIDVALRSTVADDVVRFRVFSDGGLKQTRRARVKDAGGLFAHHQQLLYTPSAGTRTIEVVADRISGSGTITIEATGVDDGAPGPSQMLVDDIGGRIV